MKKSAIIVAGGTGQRMGNAVPKQFLELLGKPVLYYSIQAFLQSFPDINIILVLPENYISWANTVLNTFETTPRVTIVTGGNTRFESVKNGLKEITEESIIFVHDGVRPLISVALIQACYEQAIKLGSAIPAIGAKESLREIIPGDYTKAVDRTKFKLIQTPQTFHSDILLPSFLQPYNELFTDEAAVVEAAGVPVHLIEGEEENIKITRPIDLVIAEELFKKRS